MSQQTSRVRSSMYMTTIGAVISARQPLSPIIQTLPLPPLTALAKPMTTYFPSIGMFSGTMSAPGN